MLRKVLYLAVAGLMLFSFTLSYAQMSKESFKAEKKGLRDQLRQERKSYADAKKQLNEKTLAKLAKITNTLKDKDARDQILLEDRKERSLLTKSYEGKRKALYGQLKDLVAEWKAAKRAAKTK